MRAGPAPEGLSPEPFVGYPRPASADTKRLEALAAGYGRLWWVTLLVIGSIVLADFRLQGAPYGIFLTMLLVALMWLVSLFSFDKIATGLGWHRASTMLLAFLFAANVPLWQLVFGTSAWASLAYTVTYVGILVFLNLRVGGELKRQGFESRRSWWNITPGDLTAFLAQRRLKIENPPVPENLFSGEGPSLTV